MVLRFAICLFVLLACDSSSSSQVNINRIDAMNFSSKHAWNLFLKVNHPAKAVSQGRGLPDLSEKIGAPGTVVVWETWRLSEKEVFLEHGERPPAWDDTSLPGGDATGKVPDPPKFMTMALAGNSSKTRTVNLNKLHQALQPLFDPDEGIFDGVGGFGESRMNKATYDFILDNELYNLEGLQKYTNEYLLGRKPLLSFPVDSIEVKAAWIELTSEQITNGEAATFYQADWNDKKYGLTSLHIITKDIPNWFWCTFHHKSAPDTGAETPDTYGQPSQLKGTVWEHYELGGTQTDFTNTIGEPTLLSDPYIEATFEQTSCITCHARATISASGGPALGSRGDIGTPKPEWFKDAQGKEVMMQTDFLWSLPFRAKSKTTAKVSGEIDSDSSLDAESVTHTIKMIDYEFVPSVLEVKSGDKVVWTNDGRHRHTATRTDKPNEFNTGFIRSGESSKEIEFVGDSMDIHYYCGPHISMRGTIRIVNSASNEKDRDAESVEKEVVEE